MRIMSGLSVAGRLSVLRRLRPSCARAVAAPRQTWRAYSLASSKSEVVEEKRRRAVLGGGERRLENQHKNVSPVARRRYVCPAKRNIISRKQYNCPASEYNCPASELRASTVVPRMNRAVPYENRAVPYESKAVPCGNGVAYWSLCRVV